MTKMDCKTFRSLIPELLLGADPGQQSPSHAAANAHMTGCAPCRAEFDGMRATFVLLDEWTAPEPTPYFESRVRAHVREAQSAAPEGLWERLTATLRFSTGRGLRSAVAGAFLVLALVSGGTVASLWTHQAPAPAASSPTVNDLRIYDNNAQAIDQMNVLDETSSDTSNAQPQS